MKALEQLESVKMKVGLIQQESANIQQAVESTQQGSTKRKVKRRSQQYKDIKDCSTQENTTALSNYEKLDFCPHSVYS